MWLDPLTKDYFNFSGTMTRKEYWMYVLLVVILAVISGILSFKFGIWIYAIYWVATVIPNSSAMTRRLHDVGKSGWWIVITFGVYIIDQILTFYNITYGPNYSMYSFYIMISIISVILGGIVTIFTLLKSKIENNPYRTPLQSKEELNA